MNDDDPLKDLSLEDLSEDYGPLCMGKAVRIATDDAPVAFDAPVRPNMRRDWTQKELPSAIKELIRIRLKLGMTQADFALALNESRDRLVNLENGRVKTLPSSVLAAARDLLVSEQDTRRKPLEKLKRMPMAKLLDRWWKMMGVESDRDGAVLLGLALLTVERWRADVSRPADVDLLRYERLANRFKLRDQEQGADESKRRTERTRPAGRSRNRAAHAADGTADGTADGSAGK